MENECKRALLDCFEVVASLAQWQSTGLVHQGSRVQIPHEAVLFGLVECLFIYFYLFIAFYWAGFTVAQRERVQEDFNVPYEGAPPHPPPICIRNTATAPGSPYLITLDANKRNLFSCGTSLQLTGMQFRLQLETFVHGI